MKWVEFTSKKDMVPHGQTDTRKVFVTNKTFFAVVNFEKCFDKIPTFLRMMGKKKTRCK